MLRRRGKVLGFCGFRGRGTLRLPLGPSRYTYEVAPVLVLMEEQVLAKLRELVGWSSGDGIFAPGIPDPSWGLSLSAPSPWQPVRGARG